MTTPSSILQYALYYDRASTYIQATERQGWVIEPGAVGDSRDSLRQAGMGDDDGDDGGDGAGQRKKGE